MAPSDEPVESPLVLDVALRDEMARTLASAAPEDWETIRYRAATVAGIADVTVTCVRGGREQPFTDAPSVSLPRRRLRAAMYRPRKGTWFSIELEISRTGTVDAQYNYDEEPAFHVSPAPDAWAQDQEKYPRDPDHQPDWLKRKLGQVSA